MRDWLRFLVGNLNKSLQIFHKRRLTLKESKPKFGWDVVFRPLEVRILVLRSFSAEHNWPGNWSCVKVNIINIVVLDALWREQVDGESSFTIKFWGSEDTNSLLQAWRKKQTPQRMMTYHTSLQSTKFSGRILVLKSGTPSSPGEISSQFWPLGSSQVSLTLEQTTYKQ